MLEYIEIGGYKSIKKLQLPLAPLNILIGGNGSGKSNFISFFRLVDAIFRSRLQRFLREEGGDDLFYFGPRRTERLTGKLIFSRNGRDNNAYRFALAPTRRGGLFIEYESSGYNVLRNDDSHNYFDEENLQESVFAKDTHTRNRILQEYISSFRVFHFHDTSAISPLRQMCDVNDNRYLKPDGRNLPAFLYYLKVKHAKVFVRIEKTIQSVAPYFAGFVLEPDRFNKQEIELRWIDAGDPESDFSAYQLSDGTLRFIALATLLMQPEPPSVIIIDEPELGLHPFAIGKLAGMMQAASLQTQIIAATQSPGLISNFKPEDVIVIDKSVEENQSVFQRLSSERLQSWLQDYSLGDLWERNILNAAQPFRK